MSQAEMFTEPPIVMHVDMTYTEGHGWHVGVIGRARGQEWADTDRTHYDGLTNAEMLDVVWAEIARRLR